jgi:hypothetical protein
MAALPAAWLRERGQYMSGLPVMTALPASLRDPQLDTPCPVIDLDVVRSNLARMAALASRSQVRLRPHAKTHKSLRIAHMQRPSWPSRPPKNGGQGRSSSLARGHRGEA